MQNILLVDDEQLILLTLKEFLKMSGGEFTVFTAGDGRKAVEVLESNDIDLLVTDLTMPEMDGFQLLEYAAERHPRIPAIVMTAFAGREEYERLELLGACSLIIKPFAFSELLELIESCLVRRPGTCSERFMPMLVV